MSTVETERMLLIPARREHLAAELDSPEALGAILEATIPADWPPPFHTDVLAHRMVQALEDPAAEDWWLHYYVTTDGDGPILVGAGGYKGPPDDDGAIEIGYALVPSARGRGYATEAAKGLIAAGYERGARVVRAEALPDGAESIRVLERVGMTPARSERAGVVAFEVRRD